MGISIKRLSKYLSICLMLMIVSVSAEQHHLDWTWQLEKAALNDSVVSISINGQLISSYEFSCDLSDALLDAQDEENSATINMVTPSSNPKGLLVVTCMVGAHSEQIVIVDPFQSKLNAEFTKVGSYFADWSLNDGQLWIKYDEPCEEKKNELCEIPFSTVDMIWP